MKEGTYTETAGVTVLMNAKLYGTNKSLTPPVVNGFWFADRTLPVNGPSDVEMIFTLMREREWKIKHVFGYEKAHPDIRNIIEPLMQIVQLNKLQEKNGDSGRCEVAEDSTRGVSAEHLSAPSVSRKTANNARV